MAVNKPKIRRGQSGSPIIRAVQGNFDHLMGALRNIAGAHNQLNDDVLAMEQTIEIVSQTAEDAGNDLDDHLADTTAVHDHGSLSGLSDDDHTQYAALAQNENISGDWNFPATGFTIGNDTEWYRDSAGIMATGNALRSAGYRSTSYVEAMMSGINWSGSTNSVVLGYDGSSNAPAIAFGLSYDTNLYRLAANTLWTDDAFGAVGIIQSPKGAASSVAYTSAVSGDTDNRYVVRADGRILWGDGSAAPDTNLFRSGADTLSTDDDFWVHGVVYLGSSADVNLYRSSANVLKTDDSFTVGDDLVVTDDASVGDNLTVGNYIRVGGDLTDADLVIIAGSDTNPIAARYYMTNAGTMAWGPGDAGQDTVLYRDGVDNLKTDDIFTLGHAQNDGTYATVEKIQLAGQTGANYYHDIQASISHTLANSGILWSLSNTDPTTHTEAMRLVATGQLRLPVTGSSAGLLLGGDALLYRESANVFSTGSGDGLHVRDSYIAIDTGQHYYGYDSGGGAQNVGSVDVSGHLNIGGSGIRTDIYSSAQVVIFENGGTALSLDLSNAGSKLTFGGSLDTTLYRVSANVLKTDGSMVVGGGGSGHVYIQHDTTPTLFFGSGNDVNLYRSAADVLKTDDAFIAADYRGTISYSNNENPFITDRRLYNSQLFNAFYNINKKATVSQTGITSFTASDLFDGFFDYTAGTNRTAAAGTGVITVDGGGVTWGAAGIIYPEGYVYLSFYYGAPPASVSGRVLTDIVGTPTWVAMSGAAAIDSNGLVWRLTVPGNNYVDKFEFTINAPAGDPADLMEIEYAPTRAAGQHEFGYFAKYAANSAFYDLTIRDTAKLKFGTSTGAGDVNLYRSSADNLYTDDSFNALNLVAWGTLGATTGRLKLDNSDGGSVLMFPGRVGVSNKGLTVQISDVNFTSPATIFGADSAGKLLIGNAEDTNLYRSGANQLKTDDSLFTGGFVNVDTSDGGTGLLFGSAADTNLYRSAASILKTDDKLIVGLGLDVLGDNIDLQGGAGTGGIYFSSGSGGRIYNDSGFHIRTNAPWLFDAQVVATANISIDGSADTPQFIVKGHSTQTSYLALFEKDDGTDLWWLTDDGHVGMKGDLYLRSGGGKINFGASDDVNLYRDAADRLKTDDSFYIGSNVRMGPTSGIHMYLGGIASHPFSIGTSGDANQKFTVDETGVVKWGPGGATAVDTNLYRDAADTLKTDDVFVAGDDLYVDGNFYYASGTAMNGDFLTWDSGLGYWVPAAASPGGGAPTTVDYLVGTASGGLSAEIVVGTTPGGELGGTWASPTVDATHSGSAHVDFIAKAFVAAKGDIVGASANDTPAITTVGADGTFLKADSGAGSGLSWVDHTGAADPHAGYRLESADHSHASTGLQGGQIAGADLTGTPGGELGGTFASFTVDATHSGSTHAGAAAAETVDIRAADVLVGSATAAFSGEIVVGTTPGGELGGTWGTPTVDATHSGSSHAGVISTHEAAGDPHTGYRLESADHSHQTTGAQAGQLDHGAALTGLSDDDHPQYGAIAQNETISGEWTFANATVVDGSADEIQLKVRGHSTQTTDVFVVEKDDNTDILTVQGNGRIVMLDDLDVGADLSVTGNTILTSPLTVNNTQLIDGSTDGIQLWVVGHSSQTSPIFRVDSFTTTGLLSVSAAGVITNLGKRMLTTDDASYASSWKYS